MPPRVVAVVVLYRPELARLQQVLTALTPQVEQVVLVHNGATTVGGTGRSAAPEAEWLEDWLNRLPLQRERICYLPQTSNIGLAAAQNLGLAQARVLQAEFVLLCDQDSVAAPDMVEALLRGHAEFDGSGSCSGGGGAGPWRRASGAVVPFRAGGGLAHGACALRCIAALGAL